MKHVILTPNPYRDKGFQTVRAAMRILKAAGVECKVCLPFEVDRSFELPKDIRFHRLDREIQNAELVICFGGDGTILHMAKTATRKNVPILGVNITFFIKPLLYLSNVACACRTTSAVSGRMPGTSSNVR